MASDRGLSATNGKNDTAADERTVMAIGRIFKDVRLLDFATAVLCDGSGSRIGSLANNSLNSSRKERRRHAIHEGATVAQHI